MLHDLLFRLAGLTIVRLDLLWLFGALLTVTLLVVLFRLQQLTQLHKFAEYLFQFACGVVAFLLFLDLAAIALKEPLDAKALIALIPALLILGFAALYGRQLFKRLKKFGPFELFEEKVEKTSERWVKVIGSVGETLEVNGVPATLSSPAVQHAYLRALVLIQQLELMEVAVGKELMSKLLFRFSQLALLQEDWWAARHSLEQVRELSGREFEAFKVAYNLGMACLQQALASDQLGNEKSKLLHQALANFDEATQREPFDADSFFWLAYVQDELGMLDLAILNNRKVLQRRDAFAPAKYNIVISRIKKKQLLKALAGLLAIRPEDELGRDTLQQAAADDELRPLLEHPIYGTPASRWLKLHQAS